jgi:hypothetical protein
VHSCPITGCSTLVGEYHLMCRSHWRMVPGTLQTAVWRAYRIKDEGEACARAHKMACARAVEAVNAALAKDTGPRLAGI